MKKLYLPYSKLSVLKDCERCFYLENHPNFKVARPQGIFSSIPSAIDSMMKEYADASGEIGGVTVYKERSLVNKMRNWRTATPYEHPTPVELFTSKDEKTQKPIGEEFQIISRGALDDIAEDGSPLDYKSKGSAPDSWYSEKYYQHQADLYALYLEQAGIEPTGKAYFVYAVPGFQGFTFYKQTVDASPDRAKKLISKAIEVLQAFDYPLPCESCNYCKYFDERLDISA